jgi:hypothetical protein
MRTIDLEGLCHTQEIVSLIVYEKIHLNDKNILSLDFDMCCEHVIEI